MARNTVVDDEGQDEDRQTASLAGLAVALALLVLSLFLFYHLREKSRIEDCLLAGRPDCVAVVPLDSR